MNHHRRFISVSPAELGSVNDKTACKHDEMVKALRHHPMFKEAKCKLYKADGTVFEETGLWLSLDGGCIHIPELLVGDPKVLTHFMNS